MDHRKGVSQRVVQRSMKHISRKPKSFRQIRALNIFQQYVCFAFWSWKFFDLVVSPRDKPDADKAQGSRAAAIVTGSLTACTADQNITRVKRDISDQAHKAISVKSEGAHEYLRRPSRVPVPQRWQERPRVHWERSTLAARHNTSRQADDRISELGLSHGIGGNMANMMMRNYLLAENLTHEGRRRRLQHCFWCNNTTVCHRRRPQAEVGDNYTNAPFLLMDPLGE